MYVLRIPAACFDRAHLSVLDPAGIFVYRRTLHIPHCGVERVEIDPAQVSNITKPIDTANLYTIQL